MSYVIFSIDNENNPMAMNVFMNHIAEVRRVFNTSNLTPCMGSYKGQKENAFIWHVSDFDRYLRGTAYIQNQESVLHVASGNKMEAYLEYLGSDIGSGPYTEPAGQMHQVCKEEAMQSEAYTYRPDLNLYWVAKQGNPDGSFRRSKEEYQ